MSTKIQWCDETWNPVTGCNPVGPGCKNCYAAKMALRLKAMGQAKYKNGFEVTFHEKCLGEPAKWKKPKKVFVCSMGDLLHRRVKNKDIHKIFQVISENQHHKFIICTKRPERLRQILFAWLYVNPPLDNVIFLTSVENQETYNKRVYDLVKCKKFFHGRINIGVSMEPLIGPVEMYLDFTDDYPLDWIILGGETGHDSRFMAAPWAESIRNQAKDAGVPFFFKSWGSGWKFEVEQEKFHMNGVAYQEFPEVFRAVV